MVETEVSTHFVLHKLDTGTRAIALNYLLTTHVLMPVNVFSVIV